MPRARLSVIGGIVLILIGGGVYLAAKFGIPLGRLPGDIRIEGGEWLVLLSDHNFDFGINNIGRYLKHYCTIFEQLEIG
jgi:hypothetical protein